MKNHTKEMNVIKKKFYLLILMILPLFSFGAKSKFTENHYEFKLHNNKTHTAEWANNEDSSSNEFEANKKYFEQLLNQHKDDSLFREVTDRGELLIGNLFKTDEKFSVLAYQTSDSTITISVLKTNRNSWDTLLLIQYESYFDEPLGKEIIDLTDFNGDGQVDLKVIYSYWHIHSGENSLLWIFNKNELYRITGFEEIVSGEYDKLTNQIYSYQSDGCGDMNMEFYVYRIVDNYIQEIKNLYCECCNCNTGNCILYENNNSKIVSINELSSFIPEYYKDMITFKTNLCK